MDTDAIRWALDRLDQTLDPYLGGVNDRLDKIIALLDQPLSMEIKDGHVTGEPLYTAREVQAEVVRFAEHYKVARDAAQCWRVGERPQ